MPRHLHLLPRRNHYLKISSFPLAGKYLMHDIPTHFEQVCDLYPIPPHFFLPPLLTLPDYERPRRPVNKEWQLLHSSLVYVFAFYNLALHVYVSQSSNRFWRPALLLCFCCGFGGFNWALYILVTNVCILHISVKAIAIWIIRQLPKFNYIITNSQSSIYFHFPQSTQTFPIKYAPQVMNHSGRFLVNNFDKTKACLGEWFLCYKRWISLFEPRGLIITEQQGGYNWDFKVCSF